MIKWISQSLYQVNETEFQESQMELEYIRWCPVWHGMSGTIHLQNVNGSRSHMQTFQTHQSTTPVLLNLSRRSHPPLELSKILSDSARAFPCAPESTYSDKGTLRMEQDLTYRIVKFWSSWNLYVGQRETSRAAETSVQLWRRLGAMFWKQWILGFHSYKAFCLSYLPLLQSQGLLHHNMGCIM